jgi:penicillin-binding protein 1A
MLNHGYITKEEYSLAKSINIEDLLVDPSTSLGPANPYQAYIDEVVAETKRITGNDPYLTSMKIYTYMNKTVQSQMDDIESGNIDVFEFPDDKVEIAGVSINNHTGAINGILGGRNYSEGGELLLNHATQQYKQPGSSVKPWLSYALAFENLGWATDHVVIDKPITYKGTDFVISNSNGRYGGETLLKDAVGWSLNTPAIQALQEVIDNKGSKYVISYLNSLGLDQVDSEHFDTGYGIGGSTFEITVVQSAAAQAMLMNGGNYIEPHTINRIEFIDGSEPVETSYLPKQVLSEESAYLATELMKSNVEGPYFSSVNLLKTNYPVYAKTGTSNWGKEATQYDIPVGIAKDVWMVGSSGDYTVNCWYGYEKAIKGEDTYFNSARLSGNVRGHTVNLLLDANETAYGEPETIDKPNGITNITHIISTYPYASAIEGMDETYLTTGLINKKFASLVSPDQQNIENFDDNQFNVDLDSKGNLIVDLPTYPDTEKLQVAPDIIDISLLDNAGNFIVESYGAKLFDYSWIFGPIKYKVKIKVNDEETEILSETETISTKIKFNPGDHVEVYGSYIFENYPIESNISTRSFDIKDEEITITIPNSVISTTAIAIIEELTSWADIYGISLTTKVVYTDNILMDNKIIITDENNEDISGSKLVKKQSELLETKLTVVIYEYVNCPDNSTLQEDGSCSCNTGFIEDGSGCIIAPTPTPTPTPTPVPTEDTSTGATEN